MKRNSLSAFIISAILLLMLMGNAFSVKAQVKFTEIDPAPFADNAHHWYDIFNRENIINAQPHQATYPPTQIKEIADNILLFQKNNGGWPKNYDVFAVLSPSQKDSVKAAKAETNTTFDNGCTYTHIAALAVAFTATGLEKYKVGALKGIDFMLKAQYKNGGWPQYYPLENNYSRHITYNDGAFQGIMEVLKAILDRQPQYAFIDDSYRKRIAIAFNKGLDCIVKTQINDTGTPNVWCQQHDEVTLQPAWARKFEPPAICNKESADLVLFLMTIDHPSKPIMKVIDDAATWFEASKIYHTRIKVIPAPRMVTSFRVSTTDKIVVTDSTAPPIWTRYYELKTHRPVFCNRDSKLVYSLDKVERERRDGYGWYTYDPQMVLDKYPEWKKKWENGKSKS